MDPRAAPCWFLHDGAAGHRRQAEALAAALAPAPRGLALQVAAPWSWLAPRRLPGAGQAFGPAFAALLREPPALAIGCGRRAALATRLLRARGSRVVQVLDPRLDPRHWDLVVAPAHDGRRGGNVLTLRGSLNPVDDGWLATARSAHPAFASLPSPRTTVLLGGPSRAVDFDAAAFARLAERVDSALAAGGGSLLVLGSRRTPADVAAAARRRWRDVAGTCWFDDRDGANPYAGALAWADRLVCSPDSVNMLSEACATQVPVFVAEPERATGRIAAFLEDLRRSGRIRPLDERLAPFPVAPLRETARIAAMVRERLGR